MVADTGGTVLRATASGRLRTTGQRLSGAVLPFLIPELECSRRLNIQFLMRLVISGDIISFKNLIYVICLLLHPQSPGTIAF